MESAAIDTAGARKARGAFFTPQPICDFITRWAIRSSSDVVFEPSCGEAKFLLSAGSRLSALGAKLNQGAAQLRGVELHEPSTQAALSFLTGEGYASEIRAQDFFDVSPSPQYDAVVGNPPYVRYQNFSGPARAKSLEAAFAQGVKLSLLSSSWAAFVIHSTQLLKKGGRLGLVLPAELLTVKYAAEVRRFLLRRFASVKLVMFEELVFPNVLEEVVLLMAEGEGPSTGFELYQARNLADLERAESHSWIRFNPDVNDKWTSALLSSEALSLFRSLESKPGTTTLLDWGETYLGAVTGNNKYFTLTAGQVSELGLKSSELLPISPPGSRHLRGLSFSKRAWAELSADDKRCHLFYPKPESLSEAAAKYIAAGEATGVHSAYKCQVRKPWWRVPLVPMADLFFTYMDHNCPRLVTNEARLYHLNSLYGVRLNKGSRELGKDLLPLSSFNSFTMLGAEMVGRSYGGGLLKIEPKEADQLPIPSALLLQEAADELRTLKPQLSIALRQGDTSRVVKAVDNILLKRLGLKPPDIRIIRDARQALFSRRTSRGGNTSGANR